VQAMIRRANSEDLTGLKAFLSRAGLSTEGLTEEAVRYFLLLENEDQTWRGTLGIEPYEENGLLRSLVVAPGQVENDILLLFQQVFLLAKEQKIQHLFLATTKNAAVPLFQLLGFQDITKAELPEGLSQSTHIKHIMNVDNLMFFKFSL
jgi:amino-acid N-acetyltransferase